MNLLGFSNEDRISGIGSDGVNGKVDTVFPFLGPLFDLESWWALSVDDINSFAVGIGVDFFSNFDRVGHSFEASSLVDTVTVDSSGAHL